MKKYLLVFACATLILTTGCGNKKNQLKCTGEQSLDSVKAKVETKVDLNKDNKVTDAVMVYDLGDKDAVTQSCSVFKSFENVDEGVKVDCSGTKITIKGFSKVIAESEKELSKDDFIELMKQLDLTCK